MREYTGYLFVHFTGESEMGEQIYFSISRDGLYWQDLNSGNPVLLSGLGEKGVRDPFILRSVEEDRYFIIATDLRIANNKGWEAAQYEGSRSLIIWESYDLITWSQERAVEVGIPGAGCVWAPEAIYDNQAGDYMVFWASMTKEQGEEKPKQKIYYAKTKDFRTFSKTEKYIERENHVIDTTIVEDNGIYYRISKDETTKRITMDSSRDLLKGPFTPIPSATLEQITGVEGPEAFRFNEGGGWCLIVDRFATNGGYMPLITEDFSTGEFKTLQNSEYHMGRNKKRHGSILNLTESEYQALENRFGGLG